MSETPNDSEKQEELVSFAVSRQQLIDLLLDVVQGDESWRRIAAGVRIRQLVSVASVAVVLPLFLVGFDALMSNGLSVFNGSMGLAWMLVIVFYAIIMTRSMSSKRVETLFRKLLEPSVPSPDDAPSMFSTQVITLSPAGIRHAYEGGTMFNEWRQVASIDELPDQICFRYRNKVVTVVPTSAFDDGGILARFVYAAQEWHGRANHEFTGQITNGSDAE